MLDKLVVSKNNDVENRRLGSFLLTTTTGALSILTFALVYSLFTYNSALGNDNLHLSALVAPVTIAEQAPPPEQPAQQKPQAVAATVNNLPTRRENMLRVDETPLKPPTNVSVAQNQQMARPNSRFTLDNSDSNPSAAGSGAIERGNGGTGSGQMSGISGLLKPTVVETAKNDAVEPPPVLKTAPKPPIVAPEKKIVSGGVVNGKAINLVVPAYSAAAKAVHAAGRVEVQVMINEDGRVVSASVVSGHPLLTPAALSAARSSKFTPTLLSNQRVKVTGIIVYNFKAQ
jgi:TonB family protein